jgi:putative ABC transport system permease protein
MENLFQDIRYALRQLRKSPGFTAVVVITLALGIGATTSIFSVVYGALLRPLPYEKPDRIVRLWEVNANGQRINFADPNFEDVRSKSRTLQGLAETASELQSVSTGADATRTMVTAVSRDFLQVMRVQPILGRSFSSEEQRFGAAPAALVSYGYWREHLNSRTDLSAIRLTFQNQAVEIIGVLPEGFSFPDDSQIWVPRELYEILPSRNAHNWRLIGRLRDGVTLEQAHAELATLARQIKQQYGQDVDMTDIAIVRLQDALTGNMRPALMILLAAVGLLLLIACANVTNLLLARAAGRRRELAIRTALGATRGRLVGQSLAETLLLSLSGGMAGVLIARWATIVLVRLAPSELPIPNDLSIQLPVLWFALGLSVAVAFGLGIFSALQGTWGRVQQTLAQNSRSETTSPHDNRVGRFTVAGQLAITLVLLTGAGLLGRSLLRVLSIDPGFRPEHVVTMNLALSFAGKDTDKTHRVQFLNELFERLGQIPGVQEVGGTGRLPLTEPLSDGTYVMMNPGEQPPRTMDELGQWFHNKARTGYANYCPISGSYFRTLGISLLRGRSFDDRDVMGAPHVAVISQSLSREKFSGRDPLGQTIEFGNMDGDLRPLTIVGVVGDVREDSLEKPPDPTIYVNYRQRPQATQQFTVLIRTDSDPSSIIPSARAILRALDPAVPPTFSTVEQILSTSLASRRFNLLLVGAFGGSALLLAMAGLYGVMAYVVARRKAEFGIRVALGASAGAIQRMVLKQGFVIAMAGVAIGILGALALTRALRSLLFGLSATDPVTLAGVSAVLIVVALAACYIPARRAAKVDPMVAIRYE